MNSYQKAVLMLVFVLISADLQGSQRQAHSVVPLPERVELGTGRFFLTIGTPISVNEPAFDTQVFPRLISLAEVGWSAKNKRNREDFSRRLESHYPRLDALGVVYFGKH